MIESRIGIDEGKGEINDYNKCDLCDEQNFPQVGWCCEHDDPAHITTICIKCLRKVVIKMEQTIEPWFGVK